MTYSSKHDFDVHAVMAYKQAIEQRNASVAAIIFFADVGNRLTKSSIIGSYYVFESSEGDVKTIAKELRSDAPSVRRDACNKELNAKGQNTLKDYVLRRLRDSKFESAKLETSALQSGQNIDIKDPTRIAIRHAVVDFIILQRKANNENNEPRHAEEKIFESFHAIYTESVNSQKAKGINYNNVYAHIYLNASPCNEFDNKNKASCNILNQPKGCLEKLAVLAKQYIHKIRFIVYFEKVHGFDQKWGDEHARWLEMNSTWLIDFFSWDRKSMDAGSYPWHF